MFFDLTMQASTCIRKTLYMGWNILIDRNEAIHSEVAKFYFSSFPHCWYRKKTNLNCFPSILTKKIFTVFNDFTKINNFSVNFRSHLFFYELEND